MDKSLTVEDTDDKIRRNYPVLCELLEDIFVSESQEVQLAALQLALQYLMQEISVRPNKGKTKEHGKFIGLLKFFQLAALHNKNEKISRKNIFLFNFRALLCLQ